MASVMWCDSAAPTPLPAVQEVAGEKKSVDERKPIWVSRFGSGSALFIRIHALEMSRVPVEASGYWATQPIELKEARSLVSADSCEAVEVFLISGSPVGVRPSTGLVWGLVESESDIDFIGAEYLY